VAVQRAKIDREEIRTQIGKGRDFVLFNHATGDPVSFHSSREYAQTKAAKLGFHYSVHNLRVGYEY
jgi:hypothetical protein